jgi:hypothetical protein
MEWVVFTREDKPHLKLVWNGAMGWVCYTNLARPDWEYLHDFWQECNSHEEAEAFAQVYLRDT